MHNDIVFSGLFRDLDNFLLREDGSGQGILKTNQTCWCGVNVIAELEVGQDVILESQVVTCCSEANGTSISDFPNMERSTFGNADLPFFGASAWVVACENSAMPPAVHKNEARICRVQHKTSLQSYDCTDLPSICATR
jgi:hypothetical protein